MSRPIVLAMTGASGAVYGGRLLEVLLANDSPVHLVISNAAREVIRTELDVEVATLPDLPDLFRATHQAMGLPTTGPLLDDAKIQEHITWHGLTSYSDAIASGSYQTQGMVICPCSMDTLSSLAHGLASNLIHRAAAVHLKERRPLIVVPRETPLSAIWLSNMRQLADAGATILPAMPGFYHRPQSIGELVDFVVARICDQLGIAHQLSKRWSGVSPQNPR